MQTKRILFASDLHCGHRSGLTPPDWQISPHRERLGKFRPIQQETWDWYIREVSQLKPFDAAVWVGDLVDGRGERSGGTELIVTDRDEQCEMAEKCIEVVGAKVNIVVRGTAYHVGEDEDWENIIAEKVGTHAKDHEWLEVYGHVFDIKHHVGASQVPYGRNTALGRDAVWNVLWAEADYQPRADIYIRAHTHAHIGGMWFAGAQQKWAFILPALQAMGTKFGARRCSGLVDFGFMHWDISENGDMLWQSHVALVRSQKAHTRKL